MAQIGTIILLVFYNISNNIININKIFYEITLDMENMVLIKIIDSIY